MKILISWYAYNHDFSWTGEGKQAKRKREISPESPTVSVHKHFWNNYDKHILLNANIKEEDVRYFEYLYSELKKEFKTHNIEPTSLPIEDVIDVNEIGLKVQKLLSQYSDCNIDVFISPGTPTMQVAWYFAASNFKNNIQLFQIRPAKFSKDKTKPEKLLIHLDKSFLPTNLNISSAIQDKSKSKTKQLITPSIENIYKKAMAVANTYDVTGLILGENGTGKEHLAFYMHQNSSRCAAPFKAVNCAAYSDDLLASELFGHVKGSFTGATENKKGLLSDANSGTVFLDEIGDISPRMQVALLRVIQEKEIQPVGSNKIEKIDVRIITATNRNLLDLCQKEIFRWDLYFRLSVAELKLPPLRERGRNEIKSLLKHFIEVYGIKFKNGKQTLTLNKEAENSILDYNYPGNIRELENLVISLYTFCPREVIAADLPEKITTPFSNNSLRLEDAEKKHITHVFKLNHNNILRTAGALAISKNTLKKKLKDYQIL